MAGHDDMPGWKRAVRGNQCTKVGVLHLWWRIIQAYLLIYGALGDDVVARPNYGIYYHRAFDITPTSDYWTHTFKIAMPAEHETTSDAERPPVETILVRTLARIDILRDQAIKDMNSAVTEIKRLIPETRIPEDRDRRALIPFFGDVGRVLFGSATEKQVRAVMGHIKILKSQTGELYEMFQEQSESYASYMHTADRRMGNAIEAIRQNHEIINNFTMAITADLGTLTYTVAVIIEHLTEQIQLYELYNTDKLVCNVNEQTTLVESGCKHFIHS